MNGECPTEVRPGGRRNQHLFARRYRCLHGELYGLHAAASDEELIGRERLPIDAGEIAGERVAQVRNTAVVGVVGFALPHRFVGGV